jgi:hypothetical protein
VRLVEVRDLSVFLLEGVASDKGPAQTRSV